MQASSVIPGTLQHEAVTAFERALTDLPAADPNRAFWAAGGRLRALGDAGLATPEWSALPPLARCRALAYAASARRPEHSRWRGAPPSEAFRGAAENAVTALATTPTVLTAALARWADLSPPEPPLGLTAAQQALALAVTWGAPATPTAAAAAAEALLPPDLAAYDLATDGLRVAIVRAHLDGGAPALAVASAIAVAPVRLQVLFELTLATAGAAASASHSALLATMRHAAETTYAQAADYELWPSASDVQIAGIMAATGGPPALAESALGVATRKLDGVLALDARVRIYRLALLATPHLGIVRWRTLLDQLLSDKQLLRSPPERTHLLFEVAASAAHFADPGARSDALARVADMLGRMPDIALRGLACAELARQLSRLPNRSPATWMAECKKALATRGTTAPFLAKTLRILAEADGAQALAIVTKLARPEDRALGAMMVAEAASGISEA